MKRLLLLGAGMLAGALTLHAQTNPTPFDLSAAPFTLTGFQTTTPAGSYPINGNDGTAATAGNIAVGSAANLVFHRTSTQDPSLAAVTTGDYSAAYNLSSGTRINGENTNGFSFVNTGTSGNLGAAVLALNTTNRTNVQVSWTGRTIAVGASPTRTYAIRLQYRVGTTAAWADASATASSIEYIVGATGSSSALAPITLPVAVENQPVVQIRWKYYYVSGSGSRPQLGVDDITVSSSGASLPACLAPTTAPTALSFPASTTTSINGSFTAASGGADGYVVFAAPSSMTTAPSLTNGTSYSSSNAPSGYTFVSNGASTTFTASGLSQGTAYNFFVFAYNNTACSGGPAYNTTALTGTTSTQSTPACSAPASASNVTVTPSFNSASGTFTAPSPAADSFVIFYGFGTTPAPSLSNGTSYNSSNTPAGYGLISKQDGSNTSFSTTGLTATTQYTVYVFAYNGIGCTGGPAYSAAASSTFTTAGVSATTYTWNVSTGSWSTPSSWTPSRIAPAATDVLVFNGATQPTPVVTVDFTSPETISQLKFQNGVVATFLTATDRTLNIGQGAAGEDLEVQVGSKLTVQASAANAGLSIVLAGTNTGVIADSVKFAGNSFGAQDHKLTANTASGLTFTSTGSLTLGSGFTSNPFGGNTVNSVLFENGSSLIQSAGSNPFSLSAPQSLVVFQPTSNYYYVPGGSAVPSIAGRTFGNFIVANSTTINATGISGNVTVNNLIVETGSLFSLAGTGTNTFTIGGDITANGPVNLNAGSGGTVFTAASPVIGGTDRVTFADVINVTNITLGNADSVVLSAAMNVSGTLTLNAGRIVTGVNTLTLGTSPAAPGTLVYNGGVVAGNFKRWIAAGTNTGTTGLFPMGRPGTGERRLATVEFSTAPTSGGSLTASVDSAAVNTINVTVTTDGTCPSGFTVTSLPGQYLTITAADGLAGGVYDFSLQYQNPGGVTNLCELAIAKRADENGVWTIDGVQDFATGSPTEPIVRHTGLMGFSDFILAGSQSNPLPLALMRFDAVAAGSAARITWSLAENAQVKHISIERSTDGRVFSAIGTEQSIAAEGMFIDAKPALGSNFYRLRMTDLAGLESVSGVRAVTFGDAPGGGILIYPNPATDAIRVKGSGSISATLYDATGRAVRTVNAASGAATISLEGLATGLYLMHATDGSATIKERVQVVR